MIHTGDGTQRRAMDCMTNLISGEIEIMNHRISELIDFIQKTIETSQTKHIHTHACARAYYMDAYIHIIKWFM